MRKKKHLSLDNSGGANSESGISFFYGTSGFRDMRGCGHLISYKWQYLCYYHGSCLGFDILNRLERCYNNKRFFGSVVECLENRAYDQHGLGSKPTRIIRLCYWEKHFTPLSRVFINGPKIGQRTDSFLSIVVLEKTVY